jgi:histidinol-phosphate aminotransferase
MVEKYPNLIVMQTFSKALGLASVRIGMAFTNQIIIKYFNKMKPPYNISTINQKAALKRIGKTEVSKNQIIKIKIEKLRLSSYLDEMNITEKVYPSDANFLLVKMKDANYIYNYLVDNSIIIRNRNSIIDNCLRITVGTRAENSKLIKALNSIVL